MTNTVGAWQATINGAMDYLANEGLTVMGLFMDKAPHAEVHKTMVTIMSGKVCPYIFPCVCPGRFRCVECA